MKEELKDITGSLRDNSLLNQVRLELSADIKELNDEMRRLA